MSDDLRADIAAAFSGGSEADDSKPVEHEVVDNSETVEEPQVQEKPVKAKSTKIETKGAPDKPAAPEKETTEEPKTTEEKPERSAKADIVAPVSWSTAAKAKWGELPPDIQKEILKRESDTSRGTQQMAQKFKPLEELDSVLSPHREEWSLQGMTDAQAVKQLLAAHGYLKNKPMEAIQYLARQYGVNLAQVGQQQSAEAQARPPLDPVMSHFMQELNGIKQTLTQKDQAQLQAQRSTIETQINDFASKPGNEYFADVQNDMALLIDSGRAKDLAEAYDMAVHMRPDIRSRIQLDQQAAKQANAAKENATKVAQAKSAGVSVRGAPGLGSIASTSAPAPTLRDEIARAFTSSRA